MRSSLGGLYQLDPTGHEGDCHAFNVSRCMVFPFLGATAGGFEAALAEKRAAAAAFDRIIATAYARIAPALPRAADAGGLLASTELDAFNAHIVATGWTVMALGWQGDKAGRRYNVSALRASIARYDELWAAYLALPAKLPGHVMPYSLLNDTFWTHPSTGQPGMRQSVDRYRNVTAW